MTCYEKLHGHISAEEEVLTGCISKDVGTGTYDGDYTAVSKVEGDYYLPTKDKLLNSDITVKKIPYYETSNLSDGITVYIGDESEVNYG